LFNIKNLINKKEGFGVIEIVAVVAVIGVLVGFNTPQFGKIVEKTQLVVDKLNNRDQMVKESEKEMSDPEFLELSDQTVSETGRLQFFIKAKNPPGDDKLRFTSSNLPERASLNNITGEFIWDTDYGDMGIHNVSVTISNSSFSTTDDFNIEVLQSNSPPVIGSIEDIIANEGDTINFNIPVSDREKDLLTYIPINIPDRATLNNDGDFN
jgi:competence protein ComGC